LNFKSRWESVRQRRIWGRAGESSNLPSQSPGGKAILLYAGTWTTFTRSLFFPLAIGRSSRISFLSLSFLVWVCLSLTFDSITFLFCFHFLLWLIKLLSSIPFFTCRDWVGVKWATSPVFPSLNLFTTLFIWTTEPIAISSFYYGFLNRKLGVKSSRLIELTLLLDCKKDEWDSSLTLLIERGKQLEEKKKKKKKKPTPWTCLMSLPYLFLPKAR